MSESRRQSLVTYMVLVACLVAAAGIVQTQDPNGVTAAFQWPIVLSVVAAGLAGVFLAGRIGVPEMLDPRVSARRRFVTPVLVGSGFGLVTAVEAWLRPGDGEVIPFPGSLLVFGAGAILVEVMLRLFGISVLAALFGLFSRSTGASWPFWTAASLAALYEPLPFLLEAWRNPAAWEWPAIVAFQLLLFNLVGAWFYRRSGFLAALSMRWGEYLVWHVIGQSLLGLR
jgi:uncharacterized integral membrane protein